MNKCDADSDTSFESEEVLDSYYPVQPRYQPLEPIGELKSSFRGGTSNKKNARRIHTLKSAVDIPDLDIGESLPFFREIQTAHSDLQTVENFREELETTIKVRANKSYLRNKLFNIFLFILQAYGSAVEKGCEKYTEFRPGEENYIRLLQGLYIRNIRQHAAQAKQLSMLCHSYTALKRKREAEEEMTTNCIALKSLVNKQTDTYSKFHSAVVTSESKQQLLNEISKGFTRVLRVQETKTSKETLLFVGQHVRTPYGEGKVVSLNTIESKVVLKLNFGQLYSSISTVINWSNLAKDSFDSTSEKSLLQHWEDLRNEFTVPAKEKAMLKEILGSASTSLAAIGADELEAFIPPPASDLSLAKMDVEQTDDASAEGSTLDTNLPSFSQQSDNGRVSVAESSEPVKKIAAFDVLASAAAAAKSSSTCRTRAASSTSEVDKLVGRVFPLPIGESPSESSVKKSEKCLRRVFKNLDYTVSSESLPLAFVNPGLK